MEPQKHRLVIEGNAFYEIDMDCVRRKEETKKEPKEQSKKKQRR